MKKIGLLSDTHGHWDNNYEKYFSNCDEIWHAGDIGSEEVVDNLKKIAFFRAVHGNIDGYPIREIYPKINRFKIEDVSVMITHIGGYPGKYEYSIIPILKSDPPQLFISGHSHILKVIYDRKYNLLHLNPGAAGISGFHKVRTLLRFIIDKTNIKNLEIIELGDR